MASVTDRLARTAGRTFGSRRYWPEAVNLTSEKEVRRRLLELATADEAVRVQAEEVILKALPALPRLPRMAKRLLNRLYFLLVVASSRNLIVNDRVTARQLGKWTVLLDQWPMAARAINKNPELAKTLEDLAGQESAFVQACARLTPPLTRDLDDLRRFFHSDPQVGEVAEHLVYLGANLPWASAAEARL